MGRGQKLLRRDYIEIKQDPHERLLRCREGVLTMAHMGLECQSQALEKGQEVHGDAQAEGRLGLSKPMGEPQTLLLASLFGPLFLGGWRPEWIAQPGFEWGVERLHAGFLWRLLRFRRRLYTVREPSKIIVSK